jgi:hypothetical protein
MSLLHIALQEGFSNDEVRIKVNGAQLGSLTGVTTKNQIGFAESLDLEPGTAVQSVRRRQTAS